MTTKKEKKKPKPSFKKSFFETCLQLRFQLIFSPVRLMEPFSLRSLNLLSLMGSESLST
jgi:hypothetical protein